jgi:hypothetical protein
VSPDAAHREVSIQPAFSVAVFVAVLALKPDVFAATQWIENDGFVRYDRGLTAPSRRYSTGREEFPPS